VSRLLAYIREAFEAIWRNRVRSGLTMLGMIIGTASIIGVLGVSKAMSGGIASQLDAFGDQGISINVDPNQNDALAAAIQYRDINIIRNSVGAKLKHIEPSYQRFYSIRAGKISYGSFTVSGGGYQTDSLTMREGRRIDDNDVFGGSHVCVMTSPLANRFFPNQPAVGKFVHIGGSRFTVVGVYDQLKGGFFTSVGGEFLVIPYTTFHEIAPGPVDVIQMYAGDGVSIATASDSVIAVLDQLHGPRAKYQSQDNNGQVQSFNSVISAISVGLTGIGGIALVVAGIGIMNIMLVSVTERTKEIGLRKSIGANGNDIALQFLLEAILLSLIGGGIGTGLGFTLVLVAYGFIEKLVGPAPIPYLLIVSVAVGFSTLIGTVFGTYPALRASRLDPIVALRS
jgi:putative ABC transport system permease protein